MSQASGCMSFSGPHTASRCISARSRSEAGSPPFFFASFLNWLMCAEAPQVLEVPHLILREQREACDEPTAVVDLPAHALQLRAR